MSAFQPTLAGGADAERLAQAAGKAMYSVDRCSQWLGLQLQEIRPGYARMTMEVRDDFLNGHNICHGGLIFTLADSTFEFACNSHNINTVAAGCAIEFLKQRFGGSKHLWMWDYKALEFELRSAGFADVRRAVFGDSADPMFAEVEQPERWTNCLGIECRRPLSPDTR